MIVHRSLSVRGAGRRLSGPACAAGLAVAASSLAARGAAEAPGPDQRSRPLVVMHSGGPAGLMPDEADAGMRRAMTMLAARLEELPQDIAHVATLMGDADDPEIAQVRQTLGLLMPLVAPLAAHPLEFAILDNGENEYGVPDIDIRLVVHTNDVERARVMASSVNTGLALAEVELGFRPTGEHGLMATTIPMAGRVMYGPADDSGRFVIGLDMGGDGLRTDPILASLPSTPGMPAPGPDAPPVAQRIFIDGRAILDVAETMAPMFGGQAAADQIAMVSESLPEGPIGFDHQVRHHDGRTYTVTRVSGLGAIQRMAGPDMVAEPVSVGLDDFAIVPRSAYRASAQGADLAEQARGLLDDPMIGASVRDAFATVERRIGIHPMDDLVAHLGPTWITYAADATGGAGFAANVFVNHGADTAGLVATMNELSGLGNAIASRFGYMRVRTWEADLASGASNTVYTMTFPGTPLPIELSMGFVGKSMVAALTPQALVAAIDQIGSADGTSSLRSNPRFRAAVRSVELENAGAITFTDSARTMREGYGMVTMLGNMMANLVRSPFDPTREPGLVVPPFDRLAEDVHPSISVTRMDGDDLVTMKVTDGSVLATLAGEAGSLSGTGLLVSAAAAGIGAAIADEQGWIDLD